MAKTINEIRTRFTVLYDEIQDVNVAMVTLEAELSAYYSTPDGRREIDATPNRGVPTEIAVDMLMQDVRSMASRMRKDA